MLQYFITIMRYLGTVGANIQRGCLFSNFYSNTRRTAMIMAVAWGYGLLDAIATLQHCCGFGYLPTEYMWSYDEDSSAIEITTKFDLINGVTTAGLALTLHVIVFANILKKHHQVKDCNI